MRLDPAVARAKFENEVSCLQTQREILAEWGCWVRRLEFPDVDVVFVPRSPAKLSHPPFEVTRSAMSRPMAVNRELGALAARAFGVRFRLDDFDQLPPSVTFRDAWTWETLPYHHLPDGALGAERRAGTRVLQQRHPETGLPFLCVLGTREYHSHPEHTGDAWVRYRDGFALFDLVALVWQTCVRPVQLHLISAGPVVPRWELR
jgi:hypothetical protein